MNNLAKKIRMKCVDIAQRPVGCHLGGCLSVADILAVLYKIFYHPDDGDVVILSKGHAAAALYSALYETNYISEDPVLSYGDKGSWFTGHPNNQLEHICFSTGSLGHGPALGLGWAFGQRLKNGKGVAYVVMGDGELQEGSCWETFQVAASLKVHNLVFIVDRNRAQNDGWVDDISPLRDIEKKARSFGLQSLTIDGHNVIEIDKAIKSRSNDAPLLIVANTIKGMGVKALEHNPKAHYVTAKEHLARKWREEIDL